ncbi:helix-turn-helix transcriptional regulator [Vibrio sp. Vb2736]|uniref:S24 family peptidase n=1 Tax=Vibrio sp. Vb2736 TaxID=2816075 RepID=UPI0028BDF9F4|nr:helix-turn-helix transcriptional regulator [Vibrio sp. Vb2736]
METISERLRSMMLKRGIKAIDLARQAKVSRGAVSHWLNGQTQPRGDTALTLANILGCSPDWLLTGKDPSNAEIVGEIDAWDSKTPLSDDEVEVPFFAEIRLSAGSGEVAEREHTGLKLRFAKSTLRRYNVPPECAVCVKATGNSMEPVLPDGSTVGIDTSSTGVVDGKMYAINHAGELRVKLLYKTPGGGLRVRSYNAEEHPEERYSQEQAKDIVVLGRVFWYSVML